MQYISATNVMKQTFQDKPWMVLQLNRSAANISSKYLDLFNYCNKSMADVGSPKAVALGESTYP